MDVLAYFEEPAEEFPVKEEYSVVMDVTKPEMNGVRVVAMAEA